MTRTAFTYYPKGVKKWLMKLKLAFTGKESKFGLLVYISRNHSLKEARQKRDDARKLLKAISTLKRKKRKKRLSLLQSAIPLRQSLMSG